MQSGNHNQTNFPSDSHCCDGWAWDWYTLIDSMADKQPNILREHQIGANYTHPTKLCLLVCLLKKRKCSQSCKLPFLGALINWHVGRSKKALVIIVLLSPLGGRWQEAGQKEKTSSEPDQVKWISDNIHLHHSCGRSGGLEKWMDYRGAWIRSERERR